MSGGGVTTTTEQALARWAKKPPSARASTEVMEALIALGDALRLGIEIPSRLRAWMSELERADLEAALAPFARDHELSRDREKVESVRRAVTRMAMSRGWSLTSVAHWEALQPTATARNADERADGGGHEDGTDAPILADESLGAAVPDDDIVLAYVDRGALALYVEGVAQRNSAFKEELTACIDALIEAGETVGETARAWRRNVNATREQRLVAPARSNVVPIGSTRSTTSSTTTSKRRWGLVGSVSLAASVLVCIGGYSFYANQKENERVQALKAREEADKQAIERLMADLKRQEEAVASAQAEAANAKSEADRAMAQAKLSEAQEQQRKTQANVQAVRAAGGPPKRNAKAACTCQAGDPLCSCL